ncbi:MAG: peptidase S9 [Pelagibacterales bacterium]|nr:peptidase S9 [Pelagibacterales bacterium]OUU63428.1 MAG: peptidase S9 [Alphaproteobacteria bacterium TMED62]|tara:strand:+ start:118 stop:2196 length:2079 start_codon:yes stop_codon:yes gene_type:complete
MQPPILKKKKSVKYFHGYKLTDYYSWVHQNNILDVLSDANLLDKDVKNYLIKENSYANKMMSETKSMQKLLFKEIKGRIKLADKSLPFIDQKYSYWSKTTEKGNYSIKLRKHLKTGKVEQIWNGDSEYKKLKPSYFGVGDFSVSHNDKLLAYSLDLKGSEYYDIHIRRLADKKNLKDVIIETNGNILFSNDDKYIFYVKLDSLHRSKSIFLHEIGKSQKSDKEIYKEKIDRFTVSIHNTSDEKYFIISSGDHSTNKCFLLDANLKNLKLKLFKDYKENITYSLNSWNGFFYNHTNDQALDFKIERYKHNNLSKAEDYINPKKNTIIGGYIILKNWFLWSETKDANQKIFLKNLISQKIEEINFFEDKIKSISMSTYQKDKDTDLIYINYSSPKSPNKTYLYNLKNKIKKIVKVQKIPSGFNEGNYITERIHAKSKDGIKIPITIIRHKNTKINGKARVLLYGYGSYGYSLGNGFSSSKYSLIDRGIIWANAHIRGGMECGMQWWKNGKMLKKKNTFEDYIQCAEKLISDKYTKEGNIIGMGGSAGGLLMGAVLNMKPKLFSSVVMAVPFVDSLTTNLDHSLPLTVGEFKEFGNAKKYKKHFDYIKSYSPYNNIKRQKYPHILVTTSLFDNRVLFDEPTKYVAKLRQFKKDKNLLLLKTEMKGGHGGKSGRDSGIEETAFDYSFILKMTKTKV